MKKILFILPNLQGGGAERVTLTVIKGLDRKKFKPTLFLIKNKGVYFNEVPDDVEVIYGIEEKDNLKLLFPLVLIKLLCVAKSANIIVGSLELYATYLAVFCGKLLRRPVIGWIHTDISKYPRALKTMHKSLIKLLYPCLNKVIAVSQSSAEALNSLVPSITHKTVVIHNPIPIDIIKMRSNQSVISDIEKPIVLGVGRLGPEKGFDILIKAHASLMQNGIRHNLVILGEGVERKNLEDLVRKLKVEDSVFMLGFKKNPYMWMKQASVFVLSSRFEGLPTVMIEAMASGAPLVACKCNSGPVEILEDGRYGILVEPENVNELASAIARLLQDKELSVKLKKDGLCRANDFSPNCVIPKFEKCFLEVTS